MRVHAILGITTMLVGGVALADDRADLMTAPRSMADAVRAARGLARDHRLIEIEFESKSGEWFYEMDFLNETEQLRVIYNARTGATTTLPARPHKDDERPKVKEMLDQYKGVDADLVAAIEAAEAHVAGTKAFSIELEADLTKDGVLVHVEVDLTDGKRRTRVDVDTKTNEVFRMNGREAFAGAQIDGDSIIFNFDRLPEGDSPKGWRAGGMDQKDAKPIWAVVEDPTAPTPKKILAVSRAGAEPKNALNVLTRAAPTLGAGTFEVRFRADAGSASQGAGIAWRAIDHANFYCARIDPLDKSVRLELVKAGTRQELARAETAIPKGEWHTLRVEHKGDHVRCFVDGVGVVEARSSAIESDGGFGVCTLGDAAVSFDTFRVTPHMPEPAKK